MKALMPIKAGEEILNGHGPVPRADMLRRYGYITDNHARYDVVELPQSTILREVQTYTHSAQKLGKRVRYGLLDSLFNILTIAGSVS